VGCVYVFVSYFLGYVSAKNWQNVNTCDEVLKNVKGRRFF